MLVLSVLTVRTFGTQPVVATCYVSVWYWSVSFSWL